MPERSLWRSIAGVCLLIATIVCCAALAANLANGAEDHRPPAADGDRFHSSKEAD